MKKATIKDVAKAVGVSEATVSYVLNNKEEQKISEEVKKKVLQWTNLLNYQPNNNAIALRINRTKNIAIISSIHLSYLQKIDLMNFLELFSSTISSRGYKISYIYQENPETINNVDAIICYNMTKEQFYKLGELNVVPLIAIDIILQDPIFYQINKDYPAIKASADNYFSNGYLFISIDPQSEEIRKEILECFSQVVFISKIEEIVEIINLNKDTNVLLIDSSIKNIFESIYPQNKIYYYNLRDSIRYEQILTCIEYAIARLTDKEHFIKI
jgi:DNA-binding LacI/PurR family transcriptional regulator